MKLSESQSESFALLHANVTNALMYAEDLKMSNRPELVESMRPVINKLQWLKSALDLKIPPDRRPAARGIDTLRYDEIARLMTHMNKDQLDALENFARTI